MPPFLLTEEGPSPSCLAVMYKQAISIHFVGQMLTSPKSSFKVQTELDLQREWRGSQASSTPPWVFIYSPAVPLGKLWASVTGLLKEVSEWPFQLAPREWSCHAQGFARELKDLRVSGFLFLADLDLYLLVIKCAPWPHEQKETIFLHRWLAVWFSAHHISSCRPPSAELRQHLFYFKEPLTSGRFWKNITT